MKKCCFIIPYFGHFNNYFPLFLKSCGYNKGFNWLIVTDDKTDYCYPENVRVLYMAFEDMVKLVNVKFGFRTALARPYKLCDLKPMYGFLFEDLITDYEYWGHCDVDMLVGNLGRFLTPELLAKYDKLFCLGHMTIYRNTVENNRVFMSDFNGRSLYKEVLLNPANSWFDEEFHDENNINQIFLSQGKKVYTKDLSLNFNIKYSRFIRVIYVGRDVENDGHGYVNEKYRKSLCLWDGGNVYRLIKQGKEIEREDFLYVHLQKRKMKVEQSVFNCSIFKIVPNKFLPLKVDVVSKDNFGKIRKSYFSNQYLKICVVPKIKKCLSCFAFQK